ncbi:MAG TPA: exopolysaccharide biosynthesis polyprenyl glycosylphosphotransferase [Vicinamibacterales bacterium]|nr:exopolysaccharide biosynthesis polyprenyl glycosylphosphotransferase [Vicinamibacterales bacterium]
MNLVTTLRRHPVLMCVSATALAPVVVVLSTYMLPTVAWQMPTSIATVVVLVGLAVAVETPVRNLFVKRVLILGANSTASKLIEEIESPRERRFVALGVVDRIIPSGPIASRWLGCFDELASIVGRLRPTHIVLARNDRRANLPLDTLLQSRVRGILVEDTIDFDERLTGAMAIEALTPDRLVLSKGFRNSGTMQGTARALSVITATVGLVVVAPLLAIIAVAVKLDSRGPVFFLQSRAGRDGRPFQLIKIRTMRSSSGLRSEWIKDNEDRVTRLGKWLRRFRLDELPQFLNVLRGEMNLIGPRPHPSSNTRLFEERIPFYGLRSAVLPGITGWAQVRYGYANTLEEETEKMRYDLYYIKHRSLWLDVRIVIETIGVMLRGGGATRVRRPTGVRRPVSRLTERRSIADAMPAEAWIAKGAPSAGRP